MAQWEGYVIHLGIFFKKTSDQPQMKSLVPGWIKSPLCENSYVRIEHKINVHFIRDQSDL